MAVAGGDLRLLRPSSYTTPLGVTTSPADASNLGPGKGADMTDKSPRKTASKKSGKSLKEKRQIKKDKGATRKGLLTK